MKKIFLCFLGYFFLLLLLRIAPRSPFRMLQHGIPSIQVSSHSENAEKMNNYREIHTLHSIHLRPWAYINAYNHAFYQKKLLPSSSFIDLPHSSKKIEGQALNKSIKEAVEEVLRIPSQVTLRHSILLKDSDFNYKYHAGLIVVRLKKYPFILKIYRETPYTFCRPFSKGIVPLLFFRTGNGASRHLSGLTRIPMCDIAKKIFLSNFAWKEKIIIPRKWLWFPQNPEWLLIKGTLLNHPSFKVKIPSLYVIVCDAIEIERPFSWLNEEDRKTAIMLSNACDNQLDANIPNFVFEKESKKIAIIDTEYFNMMLGLTKPLHPDSYSIWLTKLTQHSIKKMFFTSKKTFFEEYAHPFYTNPLYQD